MSRAFKTGKTGRDRDKGVSTIDISKGIQSPLSHNGVPKMFDRIAHRYDFLNHLLSGNLDKSWRKKVTSLLPEKENLSVLDIASGTADQLISLFQSGRVKSGIGIDLSEEMLKIGRKKIQNLNLASYLSLEKGDAENIPFGDNTFDAITISFGIRNVSDVPHTLNEIRRVLKPGGRLLILEFSLPSNEFVKGCHLFYLRHLLPHLGTIISGDSTAYRYLNETIETFPYGREFCVLLENVGFNNVFHLPLTMGVATIYRGDR